MFSTWLAQRGRPATSGSLSRVLMGVAVSFVAILDPLCATEVALGQDPGNSATLVAPMTAESTQPPLGAVATGPAVADSIPPPEAEDPMLVPETVWDTDGCPQCVPEQGRIPLSPYWDHGLRMVSEDEQFNIHLGGNAQWDSVWLIGPQGVLAEPASNSTSTTNIPASLLRRARLKADGNIYGTFDYALEIDFANAVNDNRGFERPTQDNLSSSPVPSNVWLQIRDVPLFNRLRIGNQVKPIGMANNTYQGFLPFLERPDNADAFYGPFDEGFMPGISAIDWTGSERITWRYGVFRPLKNSFGIGFYDYTVAGRVTALPVYEDDGARLLHVGIGASQGSLINDEFRIRARPLLRNGPGYSVPVIADTTTLPGDSRLLLCPELAAVLGRWTFQAEWAGGFVSDAVAANGQEQGTVFFQGGYAQILLFLTGEHEQYQKTEGVFTRVVPHNSLRFSRGSGECGPGAWQAGIRVSYLDLIDQAIDGGQIVDLTFGLNWFWNSNMKIQGNYLVAHRDGQQGAGDGWFSGLGVRAAFDF